MNQTTINQRAVSIDPAGSSDLNTPNPTQKSAENRKTIRGMREPERITLTLRHEMRLIVPVTATIDSILSFLANAQAHFKRLRDVEKVDIYPGYPYSGYARRNGRSLGVCEISLTDSELVLNLSISKTPVRAICIGPSHAKPIALWLDAVIDAFCVGHTLAELIAARRVGLVFEPDGWLVDVLAELKKRHGNVLAYGRMLTLDLRAR